MPSLEAESLCFFMNGSQFGKALKTNDAMESFVKKLLSLDLS